MRRLRTGQTVISYKDKKKELVMSFIQAKLKLESEHSSEMSEEVHKVIKSEETITENKLALKMCFVKISKSGIPKVKVEDDFNANLLITQGDVNSSCPSRTNHNPFPLPTTVNIKAPLTRLTALFLPVPVANSVQTRSNSDKEDPSHSVTVKPSPPLDDSQVQLCRSVTSTACSKSSSPSHAQDSQLRDGTWGPAGQESIISSEPKMKTPLQSQPVSSVSSYTRVLSSQRTAESPRQDVNLRRQPSPPRKKIKQFPNFKVPVSTTGPQSRPYQVKPTTGRMVRPGLSRATPRHVTSSLSPSTNTNRSNKFSAERRGNLIHLTSSDLPEGWKRFTVHKREKGRSILRLTVQNSEGNVFRSQKEVDAYIEKKKLRLNVKFRNSCKQVVTSTQLTSHVPPKKFSPPTHKSFSPIQFPKLLASRQSVPAPLHKRSPRPPPASLLPNNVGIFPSSPCMPDMPLPTLATALASLGQVEGKQKLVLFQLTEEQIRAFHTLGVREVGIVE